MTIAQVFFKRQKAQRGQMEIFSYDTVPKELRVQIVHMLNDTLGDSHRFQQPYLDKVHEVYDAIVSILCRELGVFCLPPSTGYDNHYSQLMNYILQEQDIEKLMSAIEVSFKAIDLSTRNYYYLNNHNFDERADDAIQELNGRFKEHGVGYQFIENEIIRMDSQFLHEEVVKPALKLLGDPVFKGAKDEFLKAHNHHRQGNEKEALTEALKSLESTMKAILTKRKWKYDKDKDTASRLIQICLDHDLIPDFWQGHFSALRSTLEAGVPTARNRVGGHGQGVDIIKVPPHLTSYVLHQTAAAITFLIECEKSLK